jgi:hypothetical protein
MRSRSYHSWKQLELGFGIILSSIKHKVDFDACPTSAQLIFFRILPIHRGELALDKLYHLIPPISSAYLFIGSLPHDNSLGRNVSRSP